MRQLDLGDTEIEGSTSMVGEEMTIEGDASDKGAANAAVARAKADIPEDEPDEALGDFGAVRGIFETAGDDARSELVAHLQLGAREDWTKAAQADFETHITDFDRFSFQAMAEGAVSPT